MMNSTDCMDTAEGLHVDESSKLLRVALGRWCMFYMLETPRADLRFT